MDNTGQPTPAGTAPTVLVVDDNKGVLEFLLLLLSKHGLFGVGATSGVECLSIVKSRPVDLIVLDVMMPGMDGLEVARELKNICPALPVILFNARGARSGAPRAVAHSPSKVAPAEPEA